MEQPSTRVPLDVCFVAPKAYAALARDARVQHIGGAEMQQAAIGRGLARRGHRVSFVTMDHNQPDGCDIDGVTTFKAYGRNDGVPGLRFFHPRITKLWSAMRRADARIYYQRTSDSITGVVAAFCRAHRRKFVYAVASDADTIPSLPNCSSYRERVLYRYGLHRATTVIAQSRWQQTALRENFDVDSIILHNAVPVEHTGVFEPTNGARPKVLWVGRFAVHKRLEWLFDVAQACPEYEFHVCGDGHHRDYVRHLRQIAADVPNVTLLGNVPSDEMIRKHYPTADALLCTSAAEGFPNTFLEAWSFGIPVATTFDPDGLVAEYGLGLVANDVDHLTIALRQICENDDRDGRSKHLRTYVQTHHSLDSRLDHYEEILRSL